MNDKSYKEKVGSLKISGDVITSIAKTAAEEIDGVISVGSKKGGILKAIEKFTKKSVSVSFTEESAVIDIYITVSYGAKITQVGPKVQESVKDSVQNMTSISVDKVNVYIASVEGINN